MSNPNGGDAGDHKADVPSQAPPDVTKTLLEDTRGGSLTPANTDAAQKLEKTGVLPDSAGVLDVGEKGGQEPKTLASKLAEAAVVSAEHLQKPGYAAQGVREALEHVGIEVPRSDSAHMKDIPETTKMPAETKLQPGYIVITPADEKHPHGNSFIVTPDMKAASSVITALPKDVDPNRTVYRPND